MISSLLIWIVLWRKLLRYQRVRVRQWIAPEPLVFVRPSQSPSAPSRSTVRITWKNPLIRAGPVSEYVPSRASQTLGVEASPGFPEPKLHHRTVISIDWHQVLDCIRGSFGGVRPDQDINSGYYLLPKVSESPFKRWDWGSHTWFSSSILTVTTDSSGKACLVCSTIRMRVALTTHWSHQRRSEGVVRKIRLKRSLTNPAVSFTLTTINKSWKSAIKPGLVWLGSLCLVVEVEQQVCNTWNTCVQLSINWDVSWYHSTVCKPLESQLFGQYCFSPHYKDPDWPTSIQWNVASVLFWTNEMLRFRSIYLKTELIQELSCLQRSKKPKCRTQFGCITSVFFSFGATRNAFSMESFSRVSKLRALGGVLKKALL